MSKGEIKCDLCGCVSHYNGSLAVYEEANAVIQSLPRLSEDLSQRNPFQNICSLNLICKASSWGRIPYRYLPN